MQQWQMPCLAFSIPMNHDLPPHSTLFCLQAQALPLPLDRAWLQCVAHHNFVIMLDSGACPPLGQKQGFPPEASSSHLLWAGGEMAMHRNGLDQDTIRKQGCWSSDTFLMYFHEQISAFSAGLSSRMSHNIGWFNIDGPAVITPGHA